MVERARKREETSDRQPLTGAQEVDQAHETTRRLRICPRKALEALEDLRIGKSRIKPLADGVAKAGGKADVEPATLLLEQSIDSSDPTSGEYVAVKKLRFDQATDDDRVLAPLAYELNLLRDFSHDNVVKIIGFVEDMNEGIAWMIFSWEMNGNLREFVRSADWELPERVSLIYDVAAGLDYLHGRNPPICHGDLKSLNILVNAQNRAVITDFGSARTVDSVYQGANVSKVQLRPPTKDVNKESLKAEVAATGEYITMTGPAWTIRWAAPELLEGEPPCLASDIWAFGWVCWEAITGNFPFSEEKDIVIVPRIVRGDIPDVSDNARLQQIKVLCSLMMECWRLDANERPTAIKCQKTISWMDLIIPSVRVGMDLFSNRSSELLYALGRMQLKNGIMDEALEYVQQSLEVAKSAGDVTSKARALWAIGDAYRMRNAYSRAEDAYIEARDIYYRLGNQLGYAQSLKGLGDVYHMRCEYPKAEDAYIQARDIFSRIGNEVAYAKSVVGLGDIHRMQSKYLKAEDYFTEARDIFSRIGNQPALAESMKGLGDVYIRRCEYSRAEEAYIKARDIYSQIGDQLGLAQSIRGLGDVYYVRHEDTKAEDSYIMAKETYSRLGNQLGVAQSMRGLGTIYQAQRRYSKAEEAHTEARIICSRLGNQVGFAQAVEGMGQVYSAQGKCLEAEKSYMRSREIYTRIGDRHSLANVSWYLGSLNRARARYGEAEHLVREASAIYSALGLQKNVAECDEFLDEICRLVAAKPRLPRLSIKSFSNSK